MGHFAETAAVKETSKANEDERQRRERNQTVPELTPGQAQSPTNDGCRDRECENPSWDAKTMRRPAKFGRHIVVERKEPRFGDVERFGACEDDEDRTREGND